ncbi:MAG: hypothetical protein WBC91_16700 [Phototrophicaceae bacterium]
MGALLLVLLTACNIITGNSAEESSVIPPATSNAVSSQVNAPIITVFSSSSSLIWIDDVDTIDVSWTVQNRPDNSNLVFEQVLANGTIRNAELPREVAYVPSSGNGILLPAFSNETNEMLTFQVRLIDLASNQTLASQQLVLTTTRSSEWTGVEVNESSCYDAPFFPSNNVRIGDEGRVQLNGSGNLDVYETLAESNTLTSLEAGATFLIEDGPDCIQSQHQNYAMRRWFINTGNERGWVDEYFYPMPASYAYYFIPANQVDIPTIEMTSLTVSPSTVNREEIATTDFTFTWETTHTSFLYFRPAIPHQDNLASSGSLIVQGHDLLSWLDTNSLGQFNLIGMDTQSNTQTLSTSITID